MKKLLLFSLILSTMLGCTSKTAPENYEKTILLDYYLRSDKTNFATGEVYVRHEGDTTLPNIESVTMQGTSMENAATNNKTLAKFRIDKDFGATTDYEFVVTNKGFKPISTVLSTRPINSFSIKEGVMSKTDGFNLKWKGDRISVSNETLVLLITDSKGQSMSLNRIGETAESGMFIDPVQLQYFATGPATIYLVRRTLLELGQEGYVVKKAELEYYTDELKIEITE